MKSRWCCVLLIGIAFSAILLLTGCLPLLTLFGFRAEPEATLHNYQNQCAPMLENWKAVVNDWENKASDPERSPYRYLDAETCHDSMQRVISAWDTISPPDEVKEYHEWMRLAMDYERQAFGIMTEYYQLEQTFEPDEDELRQLHDQTIELWILKDKALHKALDAYPPE